MTSGRCHVGELQHHVPALARRAARYDRETPWCSAPPAGRHGRHPDREGVQAGKVTSHGAPQCDRLCRFAGADGAPADRGWAQQVRDHPVPGVVIIVDPSADRHSTTLGVLAIDGEVIVHFAAGAYRPSRSTGCWCAISAWWASGGGEYLNAFPVRPPCSPGARNQLVFPGAQTPPPQRYPLSGLQAALQSLDDGGVLGRLLLEPKRMLTIQRYGDAVTDRRASTNSHPAASVIMPRWRQSGVIALASKLLAISAVESTTVPQPQWKWCWRSWCARSASMPGSRAQWAVVERQHRRAAGL